MYPAPTLAPGSNWLKARPLGVCTDSRAVKVAVEGAEFSESLYLAVIDALRRHAGDLLSHSLSLDMRAIYIMFVAPESAESALYCDLSYLVASHPTERPTFRLTREKADPRNIVPQSPVIVLKNLDYRVTAMSLLEFAQSLPIAARPVESELHLEADKKFKGA